MLVMIRICYCIIVNLYTSPLIIVPGADARSPSTPEIGSTLSESLNGHSTQTRQAKPPDIAASSSQQQNGNDYRLLAAAPQQSNHSGMATTEQVRRLLARSHTNTYTPTK